MAPWKAKEELLRIMSVMLIMSLTDKIFELTKSAARSIVATNRALGCGQVGKPQRLQHSLWYTGGEVGEAIWKREDQ